MKKIPSLQYARAVAALLVVLEHALGNYVTKFGWHVDDRISHLPGQIGVYGFFAISGFIIYRTSVGSSAKDFFIKRVIRVVPIYWLFTALAALNLIFKGAGLHADELIKSFLFVPYIAQGGLWRPVHQVGWTLNYEVFFYALVGLSLLINSAKYRYLPVFATLSILWVLNVPFYGSFITGFFVLGIAAAMFGFEPKYSCGGGGNWSIFGKNWRR